MKCLPCPKSCAEGICTLQIRITKDVYMCITWTAYHRFNTTLSGLCFWKVPISSSLVLEVPWDGAPHISGAALSSSALFIQFLDLISFFFLNNSLVFLAHTRLLFPTHSQLFQLLVLIVCFYGNQSPITVIFWDSSEATIILPTSCPLGPHPPAIVYYQYINIKNNPSKIK